MDCLIKLPNPPGSICVDAKFPLESYRVLRDASEEQRPAALRAFAAAVTVHVRDIADRYVLPEETAEGALMFLPSEAVYAELHASCGEVVEKANRAKVAAHYRRNADRTCVDTIRRPRWPALV